MLKKILLAIFLAVVGGLVAVTLWVEHEADFRQETLFPQGRQEALVLYHPSRDAGFGDEMSLAVAQGLHDAGLAVDRETMTDNTAPRPQGNAVIAVVSNTFWATPDLPTLRYLRRANLKGLSIFGLICGAGSTDRSLRLLGDALRKARANILSTQHFWVLRPNDEAQMDKPNRSVAQEKARRLGFETGLTVMRDKAVVAAEGAKK